MIALTMQGFDDTRAAFEHAPPEAITEARFLTNAAAQQAANAIRAAYPSVSGELRGGVAVEAVAGGAYEAAALVVSRSYKARWFEYGTAMRHNKSGAFRGRLAPNPVFTRITTDTEKQLVEAIRTLLEAFGLRVS
jgi:hypothetical protein